MSDNVCKNQKTFNKAFRKAIDKYPELERKKLSPSEKRRLTIIYIIGFIISFLLLVWAIVLAQKNNNDKVIHTLLSILFSPLYIISYYISQLNQN